VSEIDLEAFNAGKYTEGEISRIRQRRRKMKVLFVPLCFACFLTAWAYLFNIKRNQFTANVMLAITMFLCFIGLTWWWFDPALAGITLGGAGFSR
jgi:hypothetical protein